MSFSWEKMTWEHLKLNRIHKSRKSGVLYEVEEQGKVFLYRGILNIPDSAKKIN